jgi:hypothetical protein
MESLAPPKTVHVACEEVNVKDIYFAQVTVRIHSKQVLIFFSVAYIVKRKMHNIEYIINGFSKVLQIETFLWHDTV